MAVVKKKAKPAPPAKPAGKVPAVRAAAALPAKTLDFAADAGAGMENTSADDFAIPFIAILQKGSPACDEAAGTAVEGASPGMFMETATGALHEEISLIPCAYQRKFIKWGNRNAGGGFKGVFTPEQAIEMQTEGKVVDVDGKLYFPMPDGKVDVNRSDILSDTREHYVILLADEGPRQAILSLTSTQIKKSKALNSALANLRLSGPNGRFTPPTFANIVNATTNGEKNDKGSWYGIEFSLQGQLDDPELYAMGKAFHSQIAEGKARVDYNKAEAPDAPQAAGSGENWSR